MATVRLPVSSIIRLGLWEKVCEYKGWNVWILNEGRICRDEYVEFDDSFEKEDEKGKCINRMIMDGVITLNGGSPNDFTELFQDFIDQYGWTWNGNIELKD